MVLSNGLIVHLRPRAFALNQPPQPRFDTAHRLR